MIMIDYEDDYEDLHKNNRKTGYKIFFKKYNIFIFYGSCVREIK